MAIRIPKRLKKEKKESEIKEERAADDKVNTPMELIDHAEEALWEKDPVGALKYERIEHRKILNWWARFILSLIVAFTFLILIYLLFLGDLKDGHRDLVNILVGAYVAVLAKSTDYWFKDKDDPEQKEGESVTSGNNDSI